LGDEDDFQSEDDFENMETVHNLTLADLLGQSNSRHEVISPSILMMLTMILIFDYMEWRVRRNFQARHSQTP